MPKPAPSTDRCPRGRRQPVLLVATLSALVALLLGSPVLAKRSAPAPVAAVEVGEVRLVVQHFDNGCGQKGGCVDVVDRRSGKLRRSVRVYRVIPVPGLESDVQDVFITGLSVTGKTVQVTDERNRTHRFEL